MNKAIAWALCVLVLSGQAGAADLPPQLAACAALHRDAERLLCYDRAIAQIKSGAPEAPAPSAENMFGANSQVLNVRTHEDDAKREELRQISASVTFLRRGEDGMIHQLVLDNGQVWRQQDADVRLLVDEGDKITIVRAAMGTFRITDKSGRFARFKRVR
jgi:hypothetical protein